MESTLLNANGEPRRRHLGCSMSSPIPKKTLPICVVLSAFWLFVSTSSIWNRAVNIAHWTLTLPSSRTHLSLLRSAALPFCRVALDDAMNTNPPPVGPASGAVSRRPTWARRNATVAGHPQHHPTTSSGVSAEYIDNTAHVAGSATCLCSSCHLKMGLFPRTQHGRILLPDPSKPDSTTRFLTSLGPPRSRAASAAAAIATVPSVLSRESFRASGPFSRLHEMVVEGRVSRCYE